MTTPDRQDPAATDAPAASGEPIAIICGGGSFPAAVAAAAAKRGRRPVLFAIRGWADAATVAHYPHHWIALGQLGRFLRLAKAEQCREALFIGTLLRPPLSQIRLDWPTLRLIARIATAFRGGDDRLLSGVAAIIEEGGVRIVGLDRVAPEILVPEGVLGGRMPSPRDRADIACALDVIAALGPHDVGQAVVVADNHVLAIEAAEGTDVMLARVAELRRLGRIVTGPGIGVLVKAPKPTQDLRFDLPSIGPRTIESAARAGLAGVAIAAGHGIIAEATDVIAVADRAGLFVAGVVPGRAQ